MTFQISFETVPPGGRTDQVTGGERFGVEEGVNAPMFGQRSVRFAPSRAIERRGGPKLPSSDKSKLRSVLVTAFW